MGRNCWLPLSQLARPYGRMVRGREALMHSGTHTSAAMVFRASQLGGRVHTRRSGRLRLSGLADLTPLRTIASRTIASCCAGAASGEAADSRAETGTPQPLMSDSTAAETSRPHRLPVRALSQLTLARAVAWPSRSQHATEHSGLRCRVLYTAWGEHVTCLPPALRAERIRPQ